MSIRSILTTLKRWLTLPQNGYSESSELDLYRDEFAPNDPVLIEIREAIVARRARQRTAHERYLRQL